MTKPKTTFPIRSNVLDFEPYSPGLSIDEIKARFGLTQVIKMASNENPLGASPLVQKAIQNAAGSVFRYTQSGTPRLTHAIARFFNVPAESIVTGNGSDEVIDLLIRACPTPGVHNVVMSSPCFSLYPLQSKLCGISIRQIPLNTDFSFDFKGLSDAVDENTALLFITTPDNPSGYCPTLTQMKEFIASIPETCLVVVDEAYIDFCCAEGHGSLIQEVQNYPNIVVLRTFSKSFGIAGLRLGFGVMPAPLATSLCSIRPPFSVNILAEAAGIAAMEDHTFRESTMHTVHEGRMYLAKELNELGCFVYPSQANFIMFKLPESCTKNAKAVFEEMLGLGVIIRPLSSYGQADKLRVSVGSKQENKIFIESMQKVLGNV